jgi:hypothetical protein
MGLYHALTTSPMQLYKRLSPRISSHSCALLSSNSTKSWVRLASEGRNDLKSWNVGPAYLLSDKGTIISLFKTRVSPFRKWDEFN